MFKRHKLKTCASRVCLADRWAIIAGVISTRICLYHRHCENCFFFVPFCSLLERGKPIDARINYPFANDGAIKTFRLFFQLETVNG
jgi:hypothetical protein